VLILKSTIFSINILQTRPLIDDCLTNVYSQIAETQPLIGDFEELSSLEKEFADDEVYLAKIKVSIFIY